MMGAVGRRAFVIAVVATVLWVPAPAVACDGPGPEPLDVLLAAPDRPEGLYELTVVARAPNLGLRGERSATVVTRSWGPAPDDTGVVIQGDSWGVLGGSSCGPGVGDGDYFYQAVYGSDPARPSTLNFQVLAVADGIRVSAAEADALARAFGPVEVHDVSTTDRLEAYVRLWWAPVVVVGVLVWALSRLRRVGPRAD